MEAEELSSYAIKTELANARDFSGMIVPGLMRVSRYLPAYRIEGQKEDEDGLFAKARRKT